MEPLTSSLSTVKKIYETTKTIQKAYNVSKEMKNVAESEGKDQIIATKNLAGKVTSNLESKGDTGNSRKDVEGKGDSGKSSITINKEGNYNPDKNSKGKFVDKLCSDGNSKDIRKTQDVFVDRLSPNENESLGKETKIEGDNSEKTKLGTHECPQRIKTINDSLEGQRHPDTGVLYERKVVETDTGEVVEGVFPQFDSEYDAQLPEELEKDSDKKQFDECNRQLKEKCDSDPDFKSKFTPEQQADIDEGRTPEGYTWHHNEEKGKMQLVDSDTHWNTRHTGGRSIWGGGTENRK